MGRTEVDGVPVFWADVPGPLRGGLVFRTGLVDEPFAKAGWTHFVEHLALAPLGITPHAYNGSVGLTTTDFVTEGSPEEVVRTLNTVCAGLRDLPTQRIDIERNVLAAEAARSGTGDGDEVLMHRFGLDGYGATIRSEFGRHGADADGLRAWARERFVRGACAAWLSGPPPAGLDLSLPEGDVTPLPEPRPVIPPGPHHVVGQVSGATLSMLVEGGSEVTLARTVLYDRMLARLRYEAGISYSPRVYATRLRGDLMHLVLHADSLPDDHGEAARLLLEVARDVAAEVTAEEVEGVAARVEEAGRDAAIARVTVTALNSLLGLAPPPDSFADAYRAVPPERVSAFVAAGLETALLAVHDADAVPEGAGRRVPEWSPGLPSGNPLWSGDDDGNHRRIVVTETGIGAHYGPDRFVTVLWAELSGVEAYPDGARVVAGRDAFRIPLSPGDVEDYDTLRDLVDRFTPPELVAPQPSRAVREPAPAATGEAPVDERVAQYERRYVERVGEIRTEQRALRREATTAFGTLVAVLAGLVVVLALVFWGLAKLVGAGALRFAVPAVVGLLVWGWWENRKEKRGG